MSKQQHDEYTLKLEKSRENHGKLSFIEENRIHVFATNEVVEEVQNLEKHEKENQSPKKGKVKVEESEEIKGIKKDKKKNAKNESCCTVF